MNSLCYLDCYLSTNYRYEESDWGWKDKDKYAEMTEEKAQYLVAFNVTTGKPVAFTHFRFDMELDDEVVYWWDDRAINAAMVLLTMIWLHAYNFKHAVYNI